jgi:SAM-dependent methyltransferase
MAGADGVTPSGGVSRTEGEWIDRNRAHWDEVTPIHVDSPLYAPGRAALRAGRGRLTPLEERELAGLFPDGWDGLRVLHLQCHIGDDTLALAQRGATVVGLDFSMPAVLEARRLAEELGVAERARFLQANLYDARHALPEPESFDVVYTTWGTIGWLPDIPEWARIIAWFLKPGGRLYFADGHPTAFVFETDDERPDELPAFRYPYESDGQVDIVDEPGDYADGDAVLSNTVTWEWSHPISTVLGAVGDAGLQLEFFHEHYEIPWQMYRMLVHTPDNQYTWPDKKWLPLGYSLTATKP